MKNKVVGIVLGSVVLGALIGSIVSWYWMTTRLDLPVSPLPDVPSIQLPVLPASQLTEFECELLYYHLRGFSWLGVQDASVIKLAPFWQEFNTTFQYEYKTRLEFRVTMFSTRGTMYVDFDNEVIYSVRWKVPRDPSIAIMTVWSPRGSSVLDIIE